MRVKFNLKNYNISELPPSITEVNINTVDLNKLINEIAEFNKEIIWNKMWNIDDAKYRLINNWKLLIFSSEDKIKGWCWLNDKNELKNIYVNKQYRNKGIAKKLQLGILNIAKNMKLNSIECDIDDWNIKSIKSFKSIGWYEVI